jgi:hypothetical protein
LQAHASCRGPDAGRDQGGVPCAPEGFVIFRNKAQCIFYASYMVKEGLRIVPGLRHFASDLLARRIDEMVEI